MWRLWYGESRIGALPSASMALYSGMQGALYGTSAVHQILTAVYFLIFTVALVGIAIVCALLAPPKA